MLINIKKVVSNKQDYMNLLLLSDPSEKMINKYLEKSEMFILTINGEVISAAVIAKLSDTTCELKNIVTVPEYRKHGFAKQLLLYVFQNYKTTFTTMLVGTGIPAFFEKFGFQYSHTKANFYKENYPQPIIENAVILNDMIYLKKDLHTKVKAITRTEESIISLILDVAKKDNRIKSVTMNGSRINPKASKDFFQDFDVVYFVDDLDSFIKNPDWINIFGRRLILQMPETMGDNKPPYKKFSYLMQFVDGNRIDLTLVPADDKNSYLKQDSLTAVLLDKDNLMPKLPNPTDESHWIKRPTEKDYKDCLNEFWWVSTYVAKGLWRKEITYANYHIEHSLRKELLKLFDWRVGIEHKFEVSLGKCDKYLESYLPKETFDKFLRTYNLSDYERCWDALFLMIDLFRKTAVYVADNLNFTYNTEDDKNVYAYLRHIKNLPANAKTLYEER